MERKTTYYFTIARNLILAFILCGIVPIVGFALIMKSSVEETNIEKLREMAVGTVAHRGELISKFLLEKIGILEMLAGLYPEEYFMDQANVEHLYLAMKSREDFVDLQVIDSGGTQYAYVGPYRAKVAGKSYAAAPWFTETLIGGVHVSDLFAGYRDVPHFVVAVTNSLRSYVLRATINSSMFNALLHSARLGPNGDVYIINREGQFQTPSLLGQAEVDPQALALLAVESSGQRLTATDIYASHWIAGRKWLLVVKANIGDSLGYYLKVRDRIILVMIGISMVAMAGAAAASVALSRRLRQADREYGALHLQFAQLEKMAAIGRLAAGIAHEINNPLQMITNQAGWMGELLAEESPEQVKNLDEYVGAATQIKYHVRRAGMITQRLLGFSRKIASQQEQVQVNDLLEETIGFVEREAEYTNIRIIRNLAPDLPPIMTDGPQLQQVILNLLNNAIDAVQRAGEVRVASRLHDDGRVLVEIADTGPGIAPEHLKQIFDPFFTTKDPGKGTGLGLYISFDILRRLGGTIEAGNRENGGAVFSILLPVRQLEQAV